MVMISRATKLRPKDHLQVDTERLAEVYLHLGEGRASLAVDRSVEDLGCVLDLLRSQAQAGRIEAAIRTAERLQQIALPLGLSSLEQVSRDLQTVGTAQDMAAWSAVLARLDRVADRSVQVILELQAEIS